MYLLFAQYTTIKSEFSWGLSKASASSHICRLFKYHTHEPTTLSFYTMWFFDFQSKACTCNLNCRVAIAHSFSLFWMRTTIQRSHNWWICNTMQQFSVSNFKRISLGTIYTKQRVNNSLLWQQIRSFNFKTESNLHFIQ